ncbi:MAG: right-handed parallel beta-helix repeat-containing protein, partial [Acidobacteriota bacterium]
MARPSVMKRAIVRILPGVVVLLIVGSLPTLAQRTAATVEGQVIDSAGSVIPGADITAVNTNSNVVTDNRIRENGGDGILLDTSNSNVLTHNVIKNGVNGILL